MGQTAKYVMITGAVIFVIGLIWYFFGNRLTWIGRLPGDIRIERDNFRFYFPITTMILVSILLTAVLWVIRRLG